MVTPKFRASFSVLSVWDSGDWQRAIEVYFKLRPFTTRQMAAGKDLHKEWNEHIKENNSLPAVFGSKKLTSPQPEFKNVIELYDWLDLVGIIDCVDKPIIYEFKSGIRSSEAYASSMQTGVYAILATYSKIFVNKAEIYHYDQYKKATDMSVVWITDDYLKKSMNWILTLSSEMMDYFQKNHLFERFGKA